ncbi:hypothetical protein EON77_00050 [bacterium]|nr:MAG: hypothetical protein EON77_00050 [bacterium]
MPLINLIETRRIAARREERGVRIGLLTFCSTTAICILGYGFLFLQTEGLVQEQRTLTAAKEKLAPLLKRIDEDEKERSDLEPRLKTLGDAQKLTGRWGRIMQHMTTNTPRGAWLTSVRCVAQPDKPVSIALGGVGQDQSEAAEFMMRLQNDPDLDNVQLNFTQEKMLDKTSAIEFEVGADITGTEPPVKATTEEKKA